jgi:hypothetical protein
VRKEGSLGRKDFSPEFWNLFFRKAEIPQARSFEKGAEEAVLVGSGYI